MMRTDNLFVDVNNVTTSNLRFENQQTCDGMRLKLRTVTLAAFLLLTCYLSAQSTSPIHLPGLHAPARVVRDENDIAHIQARNEHDMAFLQGYVHAQDRLFQMDTLRREGSGTLAELVGPSALVQSVQLRTLGLRRAAEASLPLVSTRAPLCFIRIIVFSEVLSKEARLEC